MDRDLVTRVSRTALGTSLLAAAGGGLVAGLPGALGVLAGALISVASFRWLAWGAARAAALFAGGRAHPLWVLGLGLRYLVLFGLIVLLLRAGLHPVALMAGLAVLPPILIAHGWHSARAAL